MISGRHPSAQCLDGLLVVDAEVALERDQLARVLERLVGVPVMQVPDRRVEDVEDDDREDLDPPVEVAAVAETPSAAELATQGSVASTRVSSCSSSTTLMA